MIAGVRVNREGDPLPEGKPYLLFANHQSGFDIIVFSTVTPNKATVVAKRELKKIPVIGWFFTRGGAVLIDRSDRAQAINDLSDAAARVARDGLGVAFAPEGTRNPTAERLLPFKKGGFYLAVKGQFPIYPVVCSRIRSVVSFEERRLGPGQVTLRRLPPIETKGLTADDIPALMERVHRIMQSAFEDLNR